jgi:hypothetical protein
MHDGWVVDEAGNLIVWVPDEYRNSLWWPKMRTLIGGREPSITIGFEGACLGSEWTKIGVSADVEKHGDAGFVSAISVSFFFAPDYQCSSLMATIERLGCNASIYLRTSGIIVKGFNLGRLTIEPELRV